MSRTILGGALHRVGELEAAKMQIMKSLEEAPRFRAAHRELLEIVGKMERNDLRRDGEVGSKTPEKPSSKVDSPTPVPEKKQ